MNNLSPFPRLDDFELSDRLQKRRRMQQQVLLSDQHLVNLQTFVCAAQRLSFLSTAEYLCITPSAVSHRIRKLETHLGFSLFQRLPRQLLLTNEGKRLYFVLKDVFDQVYLEIEDISTNKLSGTLNIFSHPSVASDWLIPRLKDFAELYPFMQINIRTGNEQADFHRQNFDIALYYSNGHFSGFDSVKFMEEDSFPVCSPQYAEKHQLYNKPENLKNCTILHDANAWHYAASEAEWQTWGTLSQTELPRPRAFITFDSSRSAMYAALHHAGIAMGRLRLIEKWLQTGELVEPFFELPHMQSVYNYYAVWPKHQKNPHKLESFIDWLIQKGSESTSSPS